LPFRSPLVTTFFTTFLATLPLSASPLTRHRCPVRARNRHIGLRLEIGDTSCLTWAASSIRLRRSIPDNRSVCTLCRIALVLASCRHNTGDVGSMGAPTIVQLSISRTVNYCSFPLLAASGIVSGVRPQLLLSTRMRHRTLTCPLRYSRKPVRFFDGSGVRLLQPL